MVSLVSCEGLVEGINDNPNNLVPSDVDPILFMPGTMLANNLAQGGHANRIVSMWSGQLIGFASVYGNAYQYDISTAETNSTWRNIYIGLITNARYIREQLPADDLVQGITKVMEAHAIGTAASLFGDVPFSEIGNSEIADPAFDGQVAVFNNVIALLNEAIGNLGSATARSIGEDLYFNGDKAAWIGAANTLKARYYMILKDYPNAYTAAQSGISSSAGTMAFTPDPASTAPSGDKNLFFTIIAGSRAGDIGGNGSFLDNMINPANAAYRGNAKTDETARHAYYTIDENTASNNLGIINQYETQPLVSFEENHLILAEAGARASFGTGLTHLNEYRDWLAGGGRLNSSFSGMPFTYDAYVAADFDPGGMENADNIAAGRALIREIVEERYVSGFLTLMPFDDARRLRKADTDVQVGFAPNSGSTHAERMPYADDELNANSNGPAEDPGVFTKTAVNQ